MAIDEEDFDPAELNDVGHEFSEDDEAARSEAERMFAEDQMDELFFGEDNEENN